jgi:hypothetical protein
MAAFAVATVLVGGAAACGDDHPGDLPPPASSPPGGASETPGLELTPAEQEAVEEARAKFDEFMNAYIDVSTAPIPTAETAEALFLEVERHTDGLLPQELRTEIVGRWGGGRVISGSLDWNLVAVVDVDLEFEVNGSSFPTVFMDYCVDAANWAVVDSDSGEPAGEPVGRHLWSVEVSWSDDWGGLGLEGWRVVERENVEERKC